MNEKRSNLLEEIFICFSLNTLINHYILDYFCNDYCKKAILQPQTFLLERIILFLWPFISFHTKFGLQDESWNGLQAIKNKS